MTDKSNEISGSYYQKPLDKTVVKSLAEEIEGDLDNVMKDEELENILDKLATIKAIVSDEDELTDEDYREEVSKEFGIPVIQSFETSTKKNSKIVYGDKEPIKLRES